MTRASSATDHRGCRLRYLMALLAVAFGVALASAPSAFAASWSWGYNYMGSGVNQFVTGTWSSWTSGYVDKRSGDEIAHGWNTASGCYEYMFGTSTWSGHPSDTGTGCGGRLQRFAQWTYGNTSYLYFSSST